MRTSAEGGRHGALDRWVGGDGQHRLVHAQRLQLRSDVGRSKAARIMLVLLECYCCLPVPVVRATRSASSYAAIFRGEKAPATSPLPSLPPCSLPCLALALPFRSPPAPFPPAHSPSALAVSSRSAPRHCCRYLSIADKAGLCSNSTLTGITGSPCRAGRPPAWCAPPQAERPPCRPVREESMHTHDTPQPVATTRAQDTTRSIRHARVQRSSSLGPSQPWQHGCEADRPLGHERCRCACPFKSTTAQPTGLHEPRNMHFCTLKQSAQSPATAPAARAR